MAAHISQYNNPDLWIWLGEAQWKWLADELNSSKAKVNIIGSSIQVLSKDHGYEKWANFPESRTRLFDLIADSEAKGVAKLSKKR